MRKSFLIVVFFLLISTGLMSGCIQENTSDITINSNNAELIINNTSKPLKLYIQGSRNNITIGKEVTIKEIQILSECNNNIVWLAGEYKGDYHKHNHSLTNMGKNNKIHYYGGINDNVSYI